MRARKERALLPKTIDVSTPPTLELLLAYAHVRLEFFDDDFTREWFTTMSNSLMWRCPGTGEPIRHWPAYFRVWRKNRERFDALRDPKRLMSPSARKAADAEAVQESAARAKAERLRELSALPQSWALCAERCARFAEGRCSCGRTVPPDLLPHPIPPESCPDYAEQKGGAR